MGTETPQSDVRLPLWGVARWVTFPMLGVALLGAAIALVRDEPGVLADGLLAVVVVGLSTLAGLAVMAQASARPPGSWGPVVLLAQGVRMIGTLALGVVAYFAARPEPMVFWMLLLACSLAVLAGEVSFVVRWIRSASGRVNGEAA